VKHQRPLEALLSQQATLHELAGKLAGLTVIDLVTDDLAAVYVFKHIQVIELPTHG